MQYVISIRQRLALEWGLNFQQAVVFDFLTKLSTWATSVHTEDGIFWHIRRKKLADELPLISRSAATYKRHLQALEDAGLIEQRLIGSMPCARITEKGKSWLTDGVAKVKPPAQNCAGTCAELRSTPAQNCAPINIPSINTPESDTTRAGASARGEKKQASKKPKTQVSKPSWCSPQVWADYRRGRQAPLTPTAWARIEEQIELGAAKGHSREAMLAEAAAQTWRGFRLAWYENLLRKRQDEDDEGGDGPIMPMLGPRQ